MLDPAAAQPSPPSVTDITVQAKRNAHTTPFHELLSELNPLQYIPIVGTIYRSVTGDIIPETARTAGSLVVSGLTGGPVGIAISLAALAVEKALGIDPEKIGTSVLAEIGIGTRTDIGIGTGTGTGIKLAQPTAASSPAQPARQTAWSAAALKAVGITATADGELRHGATVGCDVLNELELARHQSLSLKSSVA